MYAQAQNPELYEQAPMPGMERPAPNPNFGQTAVANVTHLMPEGAYAQRNPEPTATISINQPQDEVSPGLRRAVDSAVDKAFNKNTTNSDTNPTATASDQTQECVDAALNIKIIGSVMSSPGDRRKQYVGTGAKLAPISPSCQTLITRETPQIFFKMQRPKNHKEWTRTKTQPLVDGDYNPVDGNAGGKGGAYVVTDPKSPYRDSKFRYRCTPGKGITHVRAVYNIKVDSAVDGSELGHRSMSTPVNVQHIPRGAPVMGGGVPGAC